MKLIPKYQKAGLVARQDNTYIAKPAIPIKPIKRTYIPTQSYVSQDNRSEWQREQNSKKANEEYKKYMEDKKMQQGLDNLNGFLNFVDAATIATGAGSLVGKGLRWGGKRVTNQLVKRKIKKETQRQMVNQGEDYTKRLMLALGDRKDSRTNAAMKFGNMTAEFADYLKQQGVDISKFTDRDLINLMSLRNESVNSNLPLSGRFTLVSEVRNKGIPIYQSELYSGRDNMIGNLSGTINGSDLQVNSVSKLNPIVSKEKRVSEDLYNSAIQYSRQRGYNGVRSGDLLQSPEITYKVWDKFPNKELIGTFGEHKFNFGETIRNGELGTKTILDGNVYRLTTPTRLVPTKNRFMFHPSLIDSNTGKLSPPNWKDSDIYKSMIPTGIGMNLFNRQSNEE